MSIRSELQERLNSHTANPSGNPGDKAWALRLAKELLRAELVGELEDAVYRQATGPNPRIIKALVELAVFESTVGR